MFAVNINEQSHSIQVITKNENTETIVASGDYIFDEPDRTILVQYNYVNIQPNDAKQVNGFLSAVITYLGNRFESLVCIRLPTIFDSQIDVTQLENKFRISNFMSTTNAKYSDENGLMDKEDQYELITDKNCILLHAESLVKMMNRNAFWATEWNVVEMQNRINSSTYIAMILDKKQQGPCGFGRLLLLRTNYGTIGYLSDVAVDVSHQSQGLGRIIVNYLVGNYIDRANENEQTNLPVTLCLRCAHKGSGAVSAPKLYQRSGFDFVNETDDHIAIFVEEKYYRKTFE